ncbi:MAG: N utilization substance protein B-like protein [Microgenomates group bacterium GW2011_GWA1_48_10]|nr:MAG: N utilization substance protein B-like protein [Microgenomates group bacterium GW2011_GWA1_48_10]
MKTASDPRHLARQKTVQSLFAWQAQNEISPQQAKLPSDPKAAALAQNLKIVDRLIKAAAPEWEINKINQIDLAILRLAVYELVIETKEPSKVIIDEAVELAKEFGNEASPSFINGALGQVLINPIRLQKIIADKLGVDEDRLEASADLYRDLNATDLEIGDLFAFLEKDYNFVFEPGFKPHTVGDLISYVEDQFA